MQKFLKVVGSIEYRLKTNMVTSFRMFSLQNSSREISQRVVVVVALQITQKYIFGISLT